MLIVILIPELVLYYAWEQRLMAQKLTDEVNKLQKSKPWLKTANPGMTRRTTSSSQPSTQPTAPPENTGDPASVSDTNQAASSDTNQATSSGNAYTSAPEVGVFSMQSKASFVVQPTEWTLQHGFFAIGGGLAVDTSSFWPHPIMTFTPDGVLELVNRGLLPDIQLESVEDKSKTDGVGKVFVCVQAAWFSAQVIARLVQRLPVTLLELHVLAHVVCAFVMYFVWFKKPYDAHSPILCTDERVINLAALFIVDTKWVSERAHRMLKSRGET
jgi:hypothetical protein